MTSKADEQVEPGEPELSDAALVRLLRRFSVESDRFVEILGQANRLHRTDMNALVVIMEATRRGEPISPGQLARALHLSASATTALLDRLEQSGHVTRYRDPGDRRRVELLMPEGSMREGEQFFRPLGAEYSRAWARFTDQERATIAAFLAATIEATVTVRATLVP